MDLWAFLWPIYSNYGIYLCLFPLSTSAILSQPAAEKITFTFAARDGACIYQNGLLMTSVRVRLGEERATFGVHNISFRKLKGYMPWHATYFIRLCR